MKHRLAARCFIIESIPAGLAAWLVLPPLFSLLIILALTYLDENLAEALRAEATRAEQSEEAQAARQGRVTNTGFRYLFEAATIHHQDTPLCAKKET